MTIDITGIQYMAWRATAQAIAGTSYLGEAEVIGEPYRPKQWGPDGTNQLFYISSEEKDYFFDAVLKTEHNNQRRITEHPVQTGANIADHSFQLPARLILEIGISDAMDVVNKLYAWNGEYKSEEKSVNAFQELLALQKTGNALKVYTRLNTYENMIIESIVAPEDFKTRYSLRATITFQQIIVVKVSSTKISLVPGTTDSVNKGKVNLPDTTSATSMPRNSFLYNITQ